MSSSLRLSSDIYGGLYHLSYPQRSLFLACLPPLMVSVSNHGVVLSLTAIQTVVGTWQSLSLSFHHARHSSAGWNPHHAFPFPFRNCHRESRCNRDVAISIYL